MSSKRFSYQKFWNQSKLKILQKSWKQELKIFLKKILYICSFQLVQIVVYSIESLIDINKNFPKGILQEVENTIVNIF